MEADDEFMNQTKAILDHDNVDDDRGIQELPFWCFFFFFSLDVAGKKTFVM